VSIIKIGNLWRELFAFLLLFSLAEINQNVLVMGRIYGAY